MREREEAEQGARGATRAFSLSIRRLGRGKRVEREPTREEFVHGAVAGTEEVDDD